MLRPNCFRSIYHLLLIYSVKIIRLYLSNTFSKYTTSVYNWTTCWWRASILSWVRLYSLFIGVLIDVTYWHLSKDRFIATLSHYISNITWYLPWYSTTSLMYRSNKQPGSEYVGHQQEKWHLKNWLFWIETWTLIFRSKKCCNTKLKIKPVMRECTIILY